jgi:hypothetical protein
VDDAADDPSVIDAGLAPGVLRQQGREAIKLLI